MEEYLEFATRVAGQADDIMRKYFRQDPTSTIKSDKTIVTIADEEINQMVIDEVHAAYPEHSVDGEEASVDKDSSHVWVCEPIDGTNPYAIGLPISVFSLALVVDGESMVAVVSAPFGDELYTAVKGGGSYRNGKKLAVNTAQLAPMVRVNFDWWSNADLNIINPLVQLSRDTGAYLLSPGSTTHMGARVATGDFAASVFAGTKGKHVDIAACGLIVEEAGGKVTDVHGNKQRYDQDIKGAVLSNGVVHDQIIEYLKSSI